MRKAAANPRQKAVFFIVALLIIAIVAYTAYGISTQKNNYMRFGIDIKGGVSATFHPSQNVVPTDEEYMIALDTEKLAKE